MADSLLQEDGSSRIDLEDLSGDLLLESATVTPPGSGGSCFIAVGGQVFRG